MSFFNNLEEKELTIIEMLIRQESRLIGIVDRLTTEKNQPHKVHLILILNNNKSILQIMALSIVSNRKVSGSLGLLDSVLNTSVSGTFANTGATSDNPAAFAASVDADGNVVVTGVAEGTGNLNVNTNASFTDSLGNPQTQTLTAVMPVTITAVVTADNVVLQITFGTPSAQ